ncbi:urokinase plasminogen activator surface receptor-like [Pygocentrus nattereri]|uniref:urokinase plasminogen activator surface receptor-like n=1 Tax=Pygocentrus nattereri TaxID=42514 RepID=UPI0008142FC7|nr:urokinase plasminogen activator surface receptor-like [Pygocentrus nattereri]
MKLQVTLALICVLFPKALALQCYQCIPGLSGTCTDTTTECPAQCISRAITVTTGDQEHEVSLKGCAAPGQCFIGSLNLGFSRMTFSSYCCSTDLCNAFEQPDFQPPPLWKECYVCTEKDCKGTLTCELGNYCITATAMLHGARMTLKGCASKHVCSAPASILKEAGIIGNVSCCSGNLCNRAKGFYENLHNSAKRIKQSLLIVVSSCILFH